MRRPQDATPAGGHKEHSMSDPARPEPNAHPLPGLYLHVPFCTRVCPYCDFAVTRDDTARRGRYVERLVAEIVLWRRALPPAFARGFDTVYLGGGTPSALSEGELARILGSLREQLPITPDARLFFEANPEDATADYFSGLRRLGVETLSLGVQSLDPRVLKFLGRRHTPGDASRAVELAREAGFPTISMDLIFGVPETIAGTRVGDLGTLRETLQEAVRLAPDHVSGYQLTFHEGTPFGRALERGQLAELPEALQAEAFELVHEVLGAGGYAPYEVSNFARSAEHRSRHNQKYWHHVPYLGLGPSAHSFDGRRRWWNLRSEAAWGEALDRGRSPVAEEETLTDRELATEALLLGLRTVAGVDLAVFRERYGVDLLERNRPVVERLLADGVVEIGGDRLRPTRAGLAVADGLAGVLEVGVE